MALDSPAKAPNSRRTILDAAAACFARQGFAQTSIDDIARAIGATKGKIYHNFRSKGELLSAVRKSSILLTSAQVEPVFLAHQAPRARFHSMAMAHVRAMIEQLPYHRVVIENLRKGDIGPSTPHERALMQEIRTLQRGYEDLFRTVITQGMQNGAFHSQPVSVALHSVLMLLNAPVFWYHPRQGETAADRDAIARQIADMALAALTPFAQPKDPLP